MANEYDKFVQDWRRRPLVGDPQTAIDSPGRGAWKGERTRVPDTGPQPHDVPHSVPPLTPNTRPVGR